MLCVRIGALLVGKFLLPARQFVELLERVVNLLVLLALRAGRLRGFVLILFGVEFEIEKAREIAACACPLRRHHRRLCAPNAT